MESAQFRPDRESRFRRRLQLFVYRQDGREIKTRLINISGRGCQLAPAEPLSVDEQVRIEIPRLGSIAATIRWSAEGKAGAEFVPQSDVWEETSKRNL